MDVLRVQMTNMLTESNIFLVRVLPNVTHLYQPLDLRVKKKLKSFMQKQFCEWYSKQILQFVENGSEVGMWRLMLSVTRKMVARVL